MPLTLITGPANSAKAGAVLDAYCAALDRDPMLVVPRFEDVAHYQREVALRGAVFGGTVLRFGWLWGEIARRAGYRAPRLGRLTRERLVTAAVRRADLRALAASAAAPGFARAAGRLIAELRSEGVEPQAFGRALEGWSAGSEGRRGYARELAAIYSAYCELLVATGRVDQEGFARGALGALRGEPGRWRRSPLFMYGFDDLTPLELHAVEVLADEVGAQVTLSLTWEDGRDAFAPRARTVERLRATAAGEDRMPALAEHYDEGSRAALHHLERGLFRGDGERVDAGDGVRLLESGGERAEVELVAAEVLRLLRDEGVAPEEVAVVFRSPRRVMSLVDIVFSAYGIPVATDRPRPLAHTALGRSLLGLLRCALAHGGADDLLVYLRAPGLVADPHAVDAFEARIRRAGKRDAAGARPLWQDGNGPLAAIDRLAGAARDGVAALTAEVASNLDSLFAAPRRADARPLTADELEDADAHAAVHGALDELAGLAALPGVPSPPPAEVLDALEQLELPGRPPPATGRVLVADPLTVRARRFRALFMCGLEEGEFPRAAAPDPFLSEEARTALVAEGLGLRMAEERLGDERFLFYAAASRPERRLYLSYRTSDEEGRPVLPSFFVDEVRSLFTERLYKDRRRRPLGDVTWAPHLAPTAAELERSLAARGPATAPPPIADVTWAPALAELASVERVSAGALEAFHGCPVKWLVEKRLRPRPLRPDDEPLTRGSFAHQVLERTFRELRERTGSGRVTAETLGLAESLADAAIDEHQHEHHLAPTAARTRAVAHLVRADVRRLLVHEAQAESPFDPSDFELSFGFEDLEPDSLPPLVLGDGEVRVRGRVDRVDVDAVTNRAIVRDYKTGRPASEHPGGKWSEGGQLQVALYMLAVMRLADHEAAGGVYQPLRAVGRKLRARGLLLDVPEVRALTESTLCREDLCPEDAFTAALAEAEATAVRLAAGMRSGRLAPTPDTCGHRGGCAYPGICRSVAA